MATRKKTLWAFVHVNGAVYGPGDQVPAEVAAQITNPKAWGEGDPQDKAGDPQGDPQGKSGA